MEKVFFSFFVALGTTMFVFGNAHAQGANEMPPQIHHPPESIPLEIPLRGMIKNNDDGTPVAYALIAAWSKRGKSFHLQARQDGTFEMLLARNDIWHISVVKDLNNFSYASSEIIIDTYVSLSLQEMRRDVLLVKARVPLPPPVRVVEPVAEQIFARLADGASVLIPPNAAISLGEGPFAAYVDLESKVSAEITATIEIPPPPKARIIGNVYDMVLKNESGQVIREFQQPITVILPYRDEEIAAQHVDEGGLFPSFFDEAKGMWITIDDFSIDTLKNRITTRVMHLTRFAIVVAADITSPAPPTRIEVNVVKNGVELTWQSPVRDFHHAKIYRSEQRGELGEIIANEVFAEKFIDEKVNNRVIYYYIVRAVDLAGNESANKDQIAIQTSITSKALPIPSVFPVTTTPTILSETPLTSPETTLSPPIPRQKLPGFFPRLWHKIALFFRL